MREKMRRVTGTGGESAGVMRVSESSRRSSFRELDDVFLQTQARIWLGEILHLRFDEETSTADLIADGELLFQVSKVLWRTLVKKNSDLKHSKLHIYEKTSSGKNDGRYMRYPKVDSFLKICQILGLTSIDLFTPSDVVDKRDTRKVCMCIRSLSIKAHANHINVPDFDVVTYTIAMPNYVVGVMCRNFIERTTSNSSVGSSNLEKSFSGIYDQNQDELHYDSDEAESCLTEMECERPYVNVDTVRSDLHEEIGKNRCEIRETENPISEPEIKLFNIDTEDHSNRDSFVSSSGSCESSVGDNWQGQDCNLTPESKLVMKNEMEGSSNRISDVSVIELEKSEDNFTEDRNLENIVGDFEVIICEDTSLNCEIESSSVTEQGENIEEEGLNEERDNMVANSTGEELCTGAEIKADDEPDLETEEVFKEKISIEEVDNRTKIKADDELDLQIEEEFSIEEVHNSTEIKAEDELDLQIEDFDEKISIKDVDKSTEIKADDELDLQIEDFVEKISIKEVNKSMEIKADDELDLQIEDFVEKISIEEVDNSTEIKADDELDLQIEDFDEKISFEEVNKSTEIKADDELEHNLETKEEFEEEFSIEEADTGTEIKADDAAKSDKVAEEFSEESTKNRKRQGHFGQKLLTTVAGGVTLAGVLLVLLQFRKRSNERNGVVGLQSRINKPKTENSERNGEKKKANSIYPGEWLKF